MNIILLSGGSGKRLWPLSNDIRSKQFIKIFKKEDGTYESMVQRMYRQIKSVDPSATVTIATSKTQVSAINNQLGENVGVSIEPDRRDTFPAIALATAYLNEVMGVDRNEPVVVCPVDPYVQDEYFVALKKVCDRAGQSDANLVLMGMEPTYPSEKYGYIIPEKMHPEASASAVSGISCKSASETSFESCPGEIDKDGTPIDSPAVEMVKEFKEKPDLETAKKYIEQGALWNGGVFAYRLSYVLDKAVEYLDYKGYKDLFDRYSTLTKISFDYAVVEKEPKIEVMRFSGEWKDLGTWNTLTEAMSTPTLGEAILNENCEDVHVINELNVPVLAMGMKGAVICASAQGILVSDKEQSSYIKPFVDKIDQQIMFAEKSWGSYQVINVDPQSQTVKVTLNPGHEMHYHSHKNRDEVWTVIAGKGRAIIDDEVTEISVGDTLTMKAGQKHKVIATTELKLIEVQIGKEISVHDKEKHETL